MTDSLPQLAGQPQVSPAPATGQSAPRVFNRRQKAAIVVRLLLEDGSDFSLTDLPEPSLAELTRQMTTLRYIDHDTMKAVAEEFLTDLGGVGLSFPSALDGALAMLDGALNPEISTRLRQQAGLAGKSDPWQQIRARPAVSLLPILQSESVEIAAVVLSKLDVAVAAEILGELPGERARRITYAMSLTGNISSDFVHKIGGAIIDQLSIATESAFEQGPVERVGAILNFSPAATRDDVLAGLEQSDSGFATQVRLAIFTFGDIPARVASRDVPKILREIDPGQLITAMAAGRVLETEATEFILNNMSQRMADQLREDMDAKGKVSEKDGDAAMTAVIVAIRNLETAGEVTLMTGQEDDA